MATRKQIQASKRRVETFTVRNTLGGVFTVSILEALAEDRVKVRVHYPTKDWDGYVFEATRSALKPEGHAEIAA